MPSSRRSVKFGSKGDGHMDHMIVHDSSEKEMFGHSGRGWTKASICTSLRE